MCIGSSSQRCSVSHLVSLYASAENGLELHVLIGENKLKKVFGAEGQNTLKNLQSDSKELKDLHLGFLAAIRK